MHVEELEITVLAADGSFPNAVRFESRAPYCLLRWDGEKLVSLPEPAAGSELAVPRHLGPMGL